MERKMKNKRVLLGVRKNSRKNQRLLEKVVNYLKTDCYMYSPLFSAAAPPPPYPTGTRTSKKRQKKRLLQRIDDFLKSDTHMYGPIVALLGFDHSLKGKLLYARKVTVEVSTSTNIMGDDLPHLPSLSLIREDQFPSSHSELSVSRRQALGRDETMKHVVHHNCRTSSAPEDGMLKAKLRKVAID